MCTDIAAAQLLCYRTSSAPDSLVRRHTLALTHLAHRRAMYLLPLTLFFFSLGLEVSAGDGINGSACSVGDQRLQVGTYQFSSDCDSMWYCAGTGICEWKTCRRDEYPFGYTTNVTLPPRCDAGFFCPDEEDSCQQVLPVGSACQFNRDGDLSSPTSHQQFLT